MKFLNLLKKNWSCKNLKSITSLIKDGSHGTHKDISDGVYLLSAKDISQGMVNFNESSRKISRQDFHQIHKNYSLKNGDILITIVGTIGRVALVKNYKNEYTLQRSVGILRANKDNSNIYLYHFFHSNYFQRQLKINENKGAQAGVYLEALGKIKIFLPTLPEQERIVAVLETWDGIIAKLEKKLKTSKKIRNALIQKLFSNKNFLEIDNLKFNLVKAGVIFKNISIKNFPNETLLSSTQDNGIIPREMLATRVTMPSVSTDNYKLVEPGNFVISLRSFQGGIEYSKFRGIVSPAYTVLKEKIQINKNFYKFYFKSTAFINRLNVAVFGIRDGKQISYEDFCTINIPLPSLRTQEVISDILNNAEGSIMKLEQKLTLLKEQKKYLLNKLVTGEIPTPENLTIFK